MPRGEKLFKFPASLMLRNFHGTAIIRFESSKGTHWSRKSNLKKVCMKVEESASENEGNEGPGRGLRRHTISAACGVVFRRGYNIL